MTLYRFIRGTREHLVDIDLDYAPWVWSVRELSDVPLMTFAEQSPCPSPRASGLVRMYSREDYANSNCEVCHIYRCAVDEYDPWPENHVQTFPIPQGHWVWNLIRCLRGAAVCANAGLDVVFISKMPTMKYADGITLRSWTFDAGATTEKVQPQALASAEPTPQLPPSFSPQVTAAIRPAVDWWASKLEMPSDVQDRFAFHLERILFAQGFATMGGTLSEQWWDSYVLKVDYDPSPSLLAALRACGIECRGFLFSAEGLLPIKTTMIINKKTGRVDVRRGRIDNDIVVYEGIK